MTHKISIIGAPVQTGTGRGGCLMGPAALRTAGIATTFASLGNQVEDQGDLTPEPTPLLAPVPNHSSGTSKSTNHTRLHISINNN